MRLSTLFVYGPGNPAPTRLSLRTRPRGSTADIAPAQGWTLCDEVNILDGRLGAANLRFSPFELHNWSIERVR